jgi:hypothetical protein
MILTFAEKLIMKVFRFSAIVLMGFGLVVLFSNFSKKQPYKSSRQNTTVKIDELTIIWDGEFNYDLKSTMYYGLSNDDHYLYVGMKTSDQILKQKIMMAGLSFWIDTNARGKEQLGLMFPLQQKPDPAKMRNRNQNSQNGKKDREKSPAEIKQFNDRYLNNLELIDYIGFGGETQLTTSGNLNENGITAILHIDSTEFLFYFACIPLEMIFNNPEAFLTDPGNQFSFSFKTNELERPSNGMGGGGPPMVGGGPSGGGGRSQGGGPPNGGGARPDADQMQAMSQRTVFTVKKAMLSPGEK